MKLRKDWYLSQKRKTINDPLFMPIVPTVKTRIQSIRRNIYVVILLYLLLKRQSVSNLYLHKRLIKTSKHTRVTNWSVVYTCGYFLASGFSHNYMCHRTPSFCCTNNQPNICSRFYFVAACDSAWDKVAGELQVDYLR